MIGGVRVYLVEVSDLKEGDVLARKIHNCDGNLLLGAGRRLSNRHIKILKGLGVDYAYIEGKQGLEEEKISQDEVSRVSAKEIKKEALLVANTCVKKVINEDTPLGLVEKEELIKLIENIIELVNDNEDLVDKMKIIRTLEEGLFFHLINVTVFSLIIGKNLDYPKDRLRDLGIGAFLHDIGKVMVSKKILNKPGKLTPREFKQVKDHTSYGYQILKDQPNIPDVAARIAYLHHERCDGSGYPKGVTSRFIDKYARIVAIADVFDAMISERVYRDPIKVNEVMEYLYTTFTENKLDRDFLEKFFRIIIPYPVGTKVRLSIGCDAVVIKLNPEMKLRPVVKLLDFSALDRNLEIDLSKDLNIEIIKEIS